MCFIYTVNTNKLAPSKFHSTDMKEILFQEMDDGFSPKVKLHQDSFGVPKTPKSLESGAYAFCFYIYLGCLYSYGSSNPGADQHLPPKHIPPWKKGQSA